MFVFPNEEDELYKPSMKLTPDAQEGGLFLIARPVDERDATLPSSDDPSND